MRKFAQIISNIFDPILLLPLLSLYTLFISWQLQELSVARILVAGFLLCVAPGLVYLWMLQTKRINDPDISNRKLRIPLFLVVCLSYTLLLLVSWWWGTTTLSTWVSLLWLILVAFTITTMFWKISVHVGMNTLVACILIWQLGSAYAFTLIIPIIIAWARIVDKQHSLAQTIVGFTVPAAIFGIWVSFI